MEYNTMTVLEEMCLYGNLEMVKFLIENGANINYQNQKGKTALMVAVEKEELDNVKILLKNKADKSLKDSSGKTALDIAKSKNNKFIIDIL